MYTTKHAQKLFDVRSDQTIRNWIREFQEFFSFDATPGKGIDFQLTEDDMRVLDLIASMRADRRPADEIHATLKAGQRGKPPEYTPEELDLVVRGDYEKYLSTQVDEMSLKMEQLTKENEELRSSIQPIRDENIHLKAEHVALEKQIEELRTQLEQERQRSERIADQERTRGQEQLERLLREIAELRYKMGQLEKKSDKEEE
jgi:regulator of replication initiation timing